MHDSPEKRASAGGCLKGFGVFDAGFENGADARALAGHEGRSERLAQAATPKRIVPGADRIRSDGFVECEGHDDRHVSIRVRRDPAREADFSAVERTRRTIGDAPLHSGVASPVLGADGQ